jgi:oligopeptide/dipeptide ABC transporter ATP-binding protein
MLLLNESELSSVRGGVVGMVFQDSLASLNPTKTVGQQVAEAVRLHDSVTRAQAEAKAVEVLGDVGLPQPRERFRSYPHQLSGGMRQRVAIAMAIACEPQLVIADEPTTALDVTVQAQILTLLRSLVDDRRMALLLITHDLGVVANVADRATVMYGGRTVEDCSVIDAFEAMRHPYTQALVASAPRLSGVDSVSDGIPGAPPNPAQPEPGCPFEPRCSFAQADCVVTPPPFITVDNGHQLACFHPLAVNEVSRG